jgi:hypothetical protein
LHHGLLVLLSHPHHLCHSHWPGLARYGLSARLAGNCSGSLGERRDGPSYSLVSRDPGLNGLSRLCAPCHPVTLSRCHPVTLSLPHPTQLFRYKGFSPPQAAELQPQW